jgi:hypothetical protein
MRRYKPLFEKVDLEKKDYHVREWDEDSRDTWEYLLSKYENWDQANKDGMGSLYNTLEKSFISNGDVAKELLKSNRQNKNYLNVGDVLYFKYINASIMGRNPLDNKGIKEFKKNAYVIVTEVNLESKVYGFNKSNKNKTILGNTFYYKISDINELLEKREGKSIEVIY